MEWKPRKEDAQWGGVHLMRCSICNAPWYRKDDAIRFSDLPEDLQAVALSEML